MGFVGLGRKYSKEELQKEIHLLASLYRQAIGVDTTTKSRVQLKQELSIQLRNVLDICRKGNFQGWETVEWNPGLPRSGNFTSLRNVTPIVEIFIEMM